MALSAADEAPHPPSGRPSWHESWAVEAFQADGSLGLRMEFVLWPDQNRSGFSMLLVRPDAPVVWLNESEAPLPNHGLEVRASGLWMAFVPQVPLDHFTADLEAFALELDHPDDALGDGYGRRVPVAGEMEWLHTPHDLTHGSAVTDGNGYRVPGRVLGDFQVGHEDLEITGWGWRTHTWGETAVTDPWRGRGRAGDWSLSDDLGLVIGWGWGLNGQQHRLVETEAGIGWRSELAR